MRRTGADGTFSIDHVPPGRYVVGVEIATPAYGPGERGPVYFPSSRDAAGARAYELAAGKPVDLGRLVVPDPPPTRGVEGRVLLPDGFTGRARLEVRHARALEGDSRWVEVESSGAFRFEALDGQPYVLEAEAGGRRGRAEIRVDGHVEGVRIELKAAARP